MEDNMVSHPHLHTLRAGILLPSGNTTLETDLFKHAPAGWSFHSARMYLEDISIISLARMVDEFAPTAARDLASVEPDLVVFSSSSAAALRGNEVEESLIRRTEDIVHAPVISAMKAARLALKKQHISHLAVITPYVNEINQQIRACLEQDGFKIERIEGFSLTRCRDMALLPIDQIINLAHLLLESNHPEGLFICGSNLPVFSRLKALKQALSCPIITTNQAVLEEIALFGCQPV
jgi:maleate isomerase